MPPSLPAVGTVAARLATLCARMVLAGRTSRRGGGSRWLVVALVITILVLLVDASIKSRSPTPGRQLAAQAWLVRANELIVQSNVQAAELAGFRDASATGQTAAKVTADLDEVTTGARDTYRTFLSLHEPVLLQSSAGLLDTCLLVRSQAVARIASAVETSLRSRSSTAAAGAAQSFAVAVQQLQIADRAYALFAQGLPGSLDDRVPPSAWVPDPTAYTSSNLQVFLAALQSRVSLAPVHLLDIVALGTSPGAIRTTGSGNAVEVLSPSSDLTVTAVVGDTGNQSEAGLTVTAAISVSSGTSSVDRFISLSPGQTNTIIFPMLGPKLGVTTTLTVTVRPAIGSPTKVVTRSIRFEMPSPTSSTTTTTVPTTTTTVPRSTSTSPPST